MQHECKFLPLSTLRHSKHQLPPTKYNVRNTPFNFSILTVKLIAFLNVMQKLPVSAESFRYSVSSCRLLLSHVQENCTNLCSNGHYWKKCEGLGGCCTITKQASSIVPPGFDMYTLQQFRKRDSTEMMDDACMHSVKTKAESAQRWVGCKGRMRDRFTIDNIAYV